MAQSTDGGADCAALDAAQVDTPLEEDVPRVTPFSGPGITTNPVIETSCWVSAVSHDRDGVSTNNISIAVRFSVNATPLRLLLIILQDKY